jgi:carboxyl-terminal processing protease
MYRNDFRLLNPFTCFLLMLFAFLGGVFVDRSGWVPGAPARGPAEFKTFWEVWDLVDKYYVDREAVQPPRMTQGAIEGMLASLGDIGHTTYLTKDELKRFKNSLAGKLEGIGARVSIRKGRPTIVQTIVGSPARKAKLRPGDIIAEVNGKKVLGMSLQRVVTLVRGKPGSTVHLRILREGQTKPLDFEIPRAKVSVPAVSWQLIPDAPIAHIAIQEFASKTDAQLRAVLAKVRRRGVKGLIIDLRGNPGGLKEEAVAVTSEFLKGGNVFLEQNADGDRKAIPVRPGGQATTIPLVVLIDEGSASSAEIFAGALQDYHRGKLVGGRTFGTGTVLRPFVLSDGSAVFLAVEQWFTPKGRQIWHKGITPDIRVSLPQGASVLLPETGHDLDRARLRKTEDEQLLKALAVLKKQLRVE